MGKALKNTGRRTLPCVDSFYSAVFLLLEGYADGICAGLGVVRSDCDLIGGTVCVARMVNAVLYVTLDSLNMILIGVASVFA